MEKQMKVIEEYGLVKTYDENENLIQLKNEKAGYYRNYTYDERNNIILEEGLGSKDLQPYWIKWDRTYNEDNSQTLYMATSWGFWEKLRYDEDFTYDYSNSNNRKIIKQERCKPAV